MLLLLIYNLFVAGVQLSLLDVNIEYIKGMFEVMSIEYSGKVKMQLRVELKYPKQIQYSSSEEHLSDMCKNLRLRHFWELQQIDKKLAQFQQCVVPTERGRNNLF